MRVTNKQMLSLVTQRVATASEQLLKAQERVASMKLINRPSDDPIGINKVLEYRKKIASIDQYARNITSAKTPVEMGVINLEEVHGLLGDAKALAMSQAASDDALGRIAAAREVANIYDHIRDIANTRLGGKYIFAGHNTDTLPFPKDEVTTTTAAASTLDSGDYFTLYSPTMDYHVWYNKDGGGGEPDLGSTGIEVIISDSDTAVEVADATETAINNAILGLSASVTDSAVTITNTDGEEIDVTDYNTAFSFNNGIYNGDSGEVSVILGEGVTQVINAHGNEVFTGSGVTDGVNIFSVLKDLKFALEASVYDSGTVGDQVGELTKGITQIEKVLSKQTTAFKRLEQTEGHWGNLKQNFEKVLSGTEDADMAQVVVELMAQQTAYEMALASAGKVLEKNLLDFLG